MVNAEKLITDHLPLWSSTIKAQKTRGRGRSNKRELYGVKKLRELILELAVRGLLIPQDPKDEPAAELLKNIATEKALLIKEKVIKKPKVLNDLSSEETPFSAPTGWVWTRLQNVSEYIQRGKGPKYAESGSVYVISQKCIQWTGFDSSVARHVDDQSLDKYQPERFLRANDLLWNSTGTGTVGRVSRLSSIESSKYVADSHVTVVRTRALESSFICCYISSSGIQSRVNPSHENPLVSGSTNQVELNTSSVSSLPIPVPPLAEQHRIVAKVDELMALCDKLEQQQEDCIETHETLVKTLLDALTTSSDPAQFQQAWQRIEANFHLLFTTESSVDHLKQTILQLAVMGKLVPQDPNDEPASQLLKKIEAEKAQLIKDKKIKKQKPLPSISEEEKPFKLPSRWVWSRIGNASLSTDYGLSDKSSISDIGVPVLAMGQIQSGQVILEVPKKVPTDVDSLPALYLEKRDLLYNRTNSAELVGKTGLFQGNDNEYTFASYLIRIRTIKDSHLPEIINLNMLSPVFRSTQVVPHFKQQCGQANVNGTIMKNMLVAVPPQAEQQRIVAKVDSLMTLCDTLKAKLQSAQTTQQTLTDTLVKVDLENLTI